MNRLFEFQANYHRLNQSQIDSLTDQSELDLYERIISLNNAILNDALKEKARIAYRSVIHTKKGELSRYEQGVIFKNSQLMKKLGIVDKSIEDILKQLSFSFIIEFDFILRKSYLSKDDQDFYIIDNPVRKEKIFKVPEVSASAWKGNLRSAMIKLLAEDLLFQVNKFSPLSPEKANELAEKIIQDRSRQILLFGIETEHTKKYFDCLTEEILKLDKERTMSKLNMLLKSINRFGETEQEGQGRLCFFPSFLDQIDLEVINPHDRKRKVGTLPIMMECSPAGSKGIFRLLYFPFDLIGNDNSIKNEAAMDLTQIAKGIKAMFTQYGFGAKTSSGFGTAEIIKDSIVIQANDNGELKNEISKARELLGGKEGGNE
jgi:CRISPR-associated protein Cmr2